MGKASERSLAADVLQQCRKRGLRIVFAESCTGGELASRLSAIAGASEVLVGSLVVYREEAKVRWLGVSSATLRKSGAVSGAVAKAMHTGALKRTPEANLAVSVTGYLGPGNIRDGEVFVTIGDRYKNQTHKLEILPDRVSGSNLRMLRRDRLSRDILKLILEYLTANF